MDINKKAQKAIETIELQLKELSNILERARQEKDFDVARERLGHWKRRTGRLLSEQIHPNVGKKLENKRRGHCISGQPLRNLEDEVKMYRSFLLALMEEIKGRPEEFYSSLATDLSVSPWERQQLTDPKAVFIVHGHDELNTLKLEKLLKDYWHLEPIVLSSEPGKGRTLIEKFEQEASRATYAIVLYTPDDLIETSEINYTQARPNVIFELGWFYSRLGREKVCILFKKGTKIHSDLDGIMRIEFDNFVEEKILELEKELKEAGLL